MGAYDYELCYRPGKQMGNADALSRLPLPTLDAVTPPPLEVLLLEMVPDAPMHAKKIANCTLKDPVMSQVLRLVLHGWPAEIPDSWFRPFVSRCHELSAHKNCVLWGSHVVVPSSAQRETKELVVDFRRPRPQPESAIIKNDRVEIVKTYKYLGVQLDDKLDWTVNTDALVSALYAVVCWGGSIKKKDPSCLDKLVRKVGSVVGTELDSMSTVAERRALSRLLSIMDNPLHPLHNIISRQRSNRLLSLP
ncbi:hypothetical protein QQF64_012099 [Cirrhinus molitorella]|uniref:Uncharacterized protein n=1 Tax=Cirrhinus molitorella TaxID=172907 RepID=A0ABR3LXP7_9TELE